MQKCMQNPHQHASREKSKRVSDLLTMADAGRPATKAGPNVRQTASGDVHNRPRPRKTAAVEEDDSSPFSKKSSSMLRNARPPAVPGANELNHLEDVVCAAQRETDRVTESQAEEKTANKVKHDQKDADHETKRRLMD